MRPALPLLALLLGLVSGGPGLAADFPDKGNPRQATSRDLTIDGVKRHYLVQPVSGAGRHPIVVMLHGGTQDALAIWRQTSLGSLGPRQGFILLAPDGMNGHWNDGRDSTIAGDPPSSADDVGFIKAAIADVVTRDGGDAAHVYLAGVSNGGFMAMRFACEAGEALAAGANIISDLPAATADHCPSTKPLPWLSLNGTADRIIPYAGQRAGTVARGQPQPELRSAEASFAFFADRAGCAPAIRSSFLPDLDKRDGSTVELRERENCVAGSRSLFYVVHDGGHITPGLKVGPLLSRVLGGDNMDVDTGSLLWDFFNAVR